MRIICTMIVILISVTKMSWAQQAQQQKFFVIQGLKGMITNFDASLIGNTFVQDSQNVFFDTDLGAKKRDKGFQIDNTLSFGTQSVSGLFRFIDKSDNQYLVAITSNVLAFSVDGGTFTTIISTLNPLFDYDCTSGLGRFWCVSSTSAFSWIGGAKTVDVSTGFPLGVDIELHKNRLWVVRESTLFNSEHLDPNEWQLAGNDTDPSAFIIGGFDGDQNTAIKSFDDNLFTFKNRSLYILSGDDNANFNLRNFSKTVGCIQSRSIQAKQNKLYWLSKRGIERIERTSVGDFRGGGYELTFPIFSDPIKDIVDKIILGNEIDTLRLIRFTSQGDFEAAVSTYTSTTQVVDSLQPSDPTINFSTPTDIFFQFVGNKVSNGSLAYKFVPRLSTKILSFTPILRYFGNDTGGISFNIFLSTGEIEPLAQILTQGPGILKQGSGTETWDDEVLFSTGNVLVQGATYWIVLTSGSYFGPGQAASLAHTVEDNEFLNVTYATVTVRGGVSPWRVFSASGALFKTIFSSSIWTSEVISTGDKLTRYGSFNSARTLDDGNVSYFIRDGDTPSSVQDAEFVTQVLGSSASITKQFFEVQVLFEITFSTQKPTIQDISIEWFDQVGKPHVASWVFDDRYWLSGSTNSTEVSFNETIIVVDKFDNFTKLNGINASSFAEAFENRYFGTSVATTSILSGRVLKFIDALNDNGLPIDAFIRTRDYCGEDCSNDKYFYTMYIRTKNDGASGGTFESKYQLNRDGTDTSLGDISLTEATGLITTKVPFTFGPGGIIGKHINMTFRNNQENHDFNFYGAKIIYQNIPVE